MWGNVLSLDAPAVAMLWAAVLARAAQTALVPAEATAMALSIWIIYAGDRLLDGKRTPHRFRLHARHRFCLKHIRAFSLSIGLASMALVWLALGHIPRSEAVAGASLAVLVAGYLTFIHAGPHRVVQRFPKEVFVGVFFALGTTLPLWSRGDLPERASPALWGAFALLCSLNCVSIERWEKLWRTSAAPFAVRVHQSRGFRIFSLVVGGIALLGALEASTTSGATEAFLLMAVSAFLLLSLDALRTRLPTSALRVLADVALIFPPLVAWVFHI
jgi:hypothetical protein